MRFSKKLIATQAALGFLLPMTASASEVNLNEINNYTRNNLSPKNIQNIIPFEDPAPAREISMIYSKSQLKLPVINALMSNISSVIRGQIKYNDIKIVSPASV